MIILSKQYYYLIVLLLEIIASNDGAAAKKNEVLFRRPKFLNVDQFLFSLQNSFRNLTIQNQIISMMDAGPIAHRDWNTTNSPENNQPATTPISAFGSSPTRPATNDNILIIDRPSGPQSFTMLMNFQTDGTSLVQILKENSYYWGDNGRCIYGKIYDPGTGFCRDVFCSEGYTLTGDGCVLETDTSAQLKPVVRQDEVTVELTVAHQLCIYRIGYNETVKCEHESTTDNDYFLESFRMELKTLLGVRLERLDDMKVKSRVVINQKLNENYTMTSERVEISFIIRDNKKFEGDNIESVTLYFWIISLTMERQYVGISEHRVEMLKVGEEKNSTATGDSAWCSDNGDMPLFFDDKEAFKVLASFDSQDIPKYYIYIRESETLYVTGDFKLSIIYIPLPTANGTQLVDEDKYIVDDYIYWDPLKNIPVVNSTSGKNILALKDVTDIVLENNQNIKSEILLDVCNHPPKIAEPCLHHETVRVRHCELSENLNRSYCSKIINECYSTNQYEEDDLEPLKYIRICKYEINENQNIVNNLDRFWNLSARTTSSEVFLSEASGWLSTIAIGLSIIFMIATLITYALFKELRNIPGWNIINLTLALLLAQMFFFMGSFIKQTPVVCFAVAIITHYGFLASFCWMNVIALDLYRNFRLNASHILLKRIKVKERLPQYALFGWLVPLVFITICVLVDIFAVQAASYRPCYAGYMEGCIKFQPINLNTNKVGANMQNISSDIMSLNRTSTVKGNNLTDTVFDSCQSLNSEATILNVAFLSRTCWISNGNANLIYFGLPIALIIIANAVLFFLTIYNIRSTKLKQKKSQLRRFSRVKAPLDRDVKFYIQMGVIMGFTWIIGFFLTSLSNAQEVILQILVYLFIVSNASQGIFIFFVFIFKRETLNLYKLLSKKYFPKLFNKSDKPVVKDQPSQKESFTMSKETSTSPSTSNRTVSTGVYDDSLRSIVSMDLGTPVSHPDSVFFRRDGSEEINDGLNSSDIAYIEEEKELSN